MTDTIEIQEEEQFETFELRPTPEDRNVRLDRFIATRIDHVSRTWIQRLIESGQVTVDGFERSQTFKMTPGQIVLVNIPPTEDDELEAENIPLDVIYEEPDLAVINKPAGMVVHPAPGHRSGTLVNALLYRYPDIAMSGTNRPGIVHRLDRETSGLIVVARTDRGRLKLLEQWADRSVIKEYLAIATGVPSETPFRIDVPIGRDPKQRNKMAALATGKTARSTVDLVEDLKQISLLAVTIETGRTHQIRVHLAHAGFPVVGDRVYNRKTGRYGGEGSIAERQMLHAFRLAFDSPSGEHLDLSVPLPGDMDAVLAMARNESPRD
jgi:23S rRNA pseudouridine1911/1915/1917 synthase